LRLQSTNGNILIDAEGEDRQILIQTEGGFGGSSGDIILLAGKNAGGSAGTGSVILQGGGSGGIVLSATNHVNCEVKIDTNAIVINGTNAIDYSGTVSSFTVSAGLIVAVTP